MLIQPLTDNQKIHSIWHEACEIAIPKGGLTVSQWSDANRVLSSESSAEPGRWSTDRNPAMREPMDCYNDPRVHTIVLMTSSQVGKSETLNNILGYSIHINPGPAMFIQPTLDRMKDYSKKRIAPMLRDTPALANVMITNGERDGDDTILSKAFVGGHLSMVGANSSSALASQPIRDILADEVDRYPLDVDDEGDPLSLAVVRTTTFSNRKIIVTSTPTVKDESRIEIEFENSDKRYYMVPCPHCGEVQKLIWRDEEKQPDGTIKYGQRRLLYETDPDNPDIVTHAYYVCVNGCMIENHQKTQMFEQGEWIATAPFNGVAGFFLNALYSVWLSFKELAERWIKAKKTTETLKVFVNTMLGQTWDRNREESDIVGLDDRCTKLGCSHAMDFPIEGEPEIEVPLGGLILTCGVDVQADRLEAEIIAWGNGEESWSVDYLIFYGDPSQADVWEQLKEALIHEYVCARKLSDGTPLTKRIIATGIDSSDGNRMQDVYRFVRDNSGLGVHAIKGSSQGMNAVIGKPVKSGYPGVWLRAIGTIVAKDAVFAALGAEKPGPNFCHFPPAYTKEYFRQLTAEKRVNKPRKFDKNDPHGYNKWMYKKIRARNEALDCRVYAYAMMIMLNCTWENLQKEENLTCERKNVKLQEDVVSRPAGTRYSARRHGGITGGINRKWR